MKKTELLNNHLKIKTNQNEWIPENNGVSRVLHFADFRSAISFILEVADYAEKVDHHPTITNTYNEVKLFLVTHTVNAITKKDIDFCNEVDKLIFNYDILN